MEEMSIKNSATFSSLVLRLMQNDKKYYAVTDSSKKAPKKMLKSTIGKNNTLTLSSKMLENSRFQAGDALNIKISKNKIILTLV
jgi:hypothetical protein